MVPTFTPEENMEQTISAKRSLEEIQEVIKKRVGESGCNLLDYEEALYFGDSKYA